MRQRQILSTTEWDAFESPPVFTSAERQRYFHISQGVEEILATLRTQANQAHFLLSLGYCRATGRFFAGKYQPPDGEYVASKLGLLPGMVDISGYDLKATASRHRKLVLDYLGLRTFGAEAERALRRELHTMVRSQIRPKSMFLRMVEFLKARKTEIPSAYALTECIAQETRQHQRELTDTLQGNLSDTQRALLDTLFEKASSEESAAPYQRYQLTLLKRFSQSTRPSRIKTNLDDLHTLRALYGQLAPVVESLDLTHEGMRSYATFVLKSRVCQIERRAEDDRHLHLVCFVAHQYYRLQDTLIDVLLTCVQTFLNTCNREHKERTYEDRREHRRSVKAFVKVVQEGACTPLTEIERIVFCEDLGDTEKVQRIQGVLTTGHPQRETMEHQVAQLSDPLSQGAEDTEYYDILEAKSLQLQNRVAEIVKAIDFLGEEHAALSTALRYYRDKNGTLGQTAPLDFLDAQAQPLVLSDTGKLRVSLYKALLFIKVAEAVKAGVLNVRDSYKYRSLDDYLLPKAAWQREREEYLERAELTSAADCAPLLAALAQSLDAQFGETNRRILAGENPHLHFPKDGTFHVQTPKAEDEAGEALASVFPESGAISLLEVLSTVNRLSHFVDDFHHWQGRRNRGKPPDRLFFAGTLGYGCFIGTRKMARISKGINEAELDNVVNWYFSLDNVHAANDRLLRFMDQLELPELYRTQPGLLHTSSDGQKFAVSVDSLNATYSFKYFGQGKGVSAYNFIDERHFGFHSTVFSSAEREAAYVVDGLMHNDVVKSALHSTDTHGYSEAIFAVTHLLGFTFAPRIKNLKKQSLSSFPQHRRKAYAAQGFRVLPEGYINTQLIADQWDEILRFVATIKLKETTASQLFKRLNSYSKQHPLWHALKEFGKVIKTRFILRYLNEVAFRQAIEKQLNKGESSNKFSRAISFGNNQEFLYGEKVEQEIAEGCRRLIKNAIICWNYLFLSQKIAEERDPQCRQRLINAVRTGSVASWQHLNLQGEYDFSDEKMQDSVGLRVRKNLALATV